MFKTDSTANRINPLESKRFSGQDFSDLTCLRTLLKYNIF